MTKCCFDTGIIDDVIVFSGNKLIGYYEFGISQYIIDRLHNYNPTLVASSTGAIAAVMIACKLDVMCCVRRSIHLLKTYKVLNKRFSSIRKLFLKEWLESILPQDAHIQCTNKVHILVNRLWKSTLDLSIFPSRAFLIDALLATCFIPTFSHPVVCFSRSLCLGGIVNIETTKYEFLEKKVFGFHTDETNHYNLLDTNRVPSVAEIWEMTRCGYNAAKFYFQGGNNFSKTYLK